MYINHDPVLAFSYFMARSTKSRVRLNGENLKCYLKGKTGRNWANGQSNNDSAKNWTLVGHQRLACPTQGQ